MRTPQPLPSDLDDAPFRFGDALTGGVTARRMRASDLDTPFRGVRAVSRGYDPESLLHRCRAFATRVPVGGYFCRETAARLHGIPLPGGADPRLHVACPAPHRAMDTADAVGHQFETDPADVVEVDGIRVASAARTWCELGAVLPITWLVVAGDFLVREPGGVGADHLHDTLRRFRGRRGRRGLAAAFRLLDRRSESPRESQLRVLIWSAGLPLPDVQHTVRTASGGFVARVDLAYPALRLAIEYDGDHHRTDRDQWHRDVERRNRLRDLGWTIVEVTAADLRTPSALLSRLSHHLGIH